MIDGVGVGVDVLDGDIIGVVVGAGGKLFIKPPRPPLL